jgi:hypothetical protein
LAEELITSLPFIYSDRLFENRVDRCFQKAWDHGPLDAEAVPEGANSASDWTVLAPSLLLCCAVRQTVCSPRGGTSTLPTLRFYRSAQTRTADFQKRLSWQMLLTQRSLRRRDLVFHSSPDTVFAKRRARPDLLY